MKKRIAWRYTCEHCGKSGAAGGHISKHERFCTKNPQRDCRMCRMVGNKPVAMATLLAAVKPEPDPQFDYLVRKADLTDVRRLCGGCPACLLAVARQYNQPPCDDPVAPPDFSWETERDAWMEDYRNSMVPTMSGDAVFDRNEWDERRAKRATP
jgi:hypothetical protein